MSNRIKFFQKEKDMVGGIEVKELKTGQSKSMKLPSNFQEMERFIKENKIELMENILDSIEYGIRRKYELIEVFSFDKSNFVVTISKNELSNTIENIFKYYLETENYELCSRIKQIKKLMKRKRVM